MRYELEQRTANRIFYLGAVFAAWVFASICMYYSGSVYLATDFLSGSVLIGFFGVVYIWCQHRRGK